MEGGTEHALTGERNGSGLWMVHRRTPSPVRTHLKSVHQQSGAILSIAGPRGLTTGRVGADAGGVS